MITQDKIEVYKKFRGNIDDWARIGSKKEKLVLNDNDWYIIDGFVQDLSLMRKGLTSLTFVNDLNHRFKENCDSDETIQALKSISGS
jgi:hypothetical protein